MHNGKEAVTHAIHVAAQGLKGVAPTAPEIGAMHTLENGIYASSEILFSDL